MIKKIFSSKKRIAITILAIFIMLGYVSSLYGSYQRLRKSDVYLDKAQERKAELEEKKLALLQRLEVVESEEFTEFQAREKLGLVKEGEYVVILPEEEILRRLSPRKIEQEKFELPNPNWRVWAEVLFGV